MSSVSFGPRSGLSKSSLLVTAAVAVMLAGCSNAVERFAQNPSDSDPVYTASVKGKKKPVEEQSASADETISSKPLASTNLSKSKYSYDTAQNGQEQEVAAPVYKQAAAPEASGGRVKVGQGMTLYSIAKANGITVSKLAAANNLKPPYAVRQGQMLRIPGVDEAVAPKVAETITDSEAETPAKLPFKKVASANTGSGAHEVTSGDTLFSLGRKYGVSPYAIADANGLSKTAGLKLGQQLKIPGAGTSSPKRPKKVTEQVAAAEDTVTEEIPAKTDVAEANAAPEKTVTPDQTVAIADSGASGFRWPVKGKVISEFGAKPNGLKNEGINISVPEGTSVRAAGDGVVAYSGNELKGYGNLVLIRHTGGWVTAYAHAKELFVKRGDTVKRGDVIAKAGQTGSVSSPQLHFEVRKGAVAMDPLKYLDKTTASN